MDLRHGGQKDEEMLFFKFAFNGNAFILRQIASRQSHSVC